jgi:hypothetical protein
MTYTEMTHSAAVNFLELTATHLKPYYQLSSEISPENYFSIRIPGRKRHF